MSESNGRANIREVYEIARRIEDKLDAQSQRVARVEQRLDDHESQEGHPEVTSQLRGLYWRLTLMASILTAIGWSANQYLRT